MRWADTDRINRACAALRQPSRAEALGLTVEEAADCINDGFAAAARDFASAMKALAAGLDAFATTFGETLAAENRQPIAVQEVVR